MVKNGGQVAKNIHKQIVDKYYDGDVELAKNFGVWWKNKDETQQHGYCTGAVGSVADEGHNVGEMLAFERIDADFDGFFVEPYSSWLLCIYEVR